MNGTIFKRRAAASAIADTNTRPKMQRGAALLGCDVSGKRCVMVDKTRAGKLNRLDKLHRCFQWLEYFHARGMIEEADVVVNMIMRELNAVKVLRAAQ